MFLLIAPVMISATALPPSRTLMLGALVVAAATLLFFFHLPLPWYPGEVFSLPPLYGLAVWAALVSTLSFLGIYAFRVAEEARRLSDALTATELILARENHLTALDGLAAAAAHELGTPLATIALVATELETELDEDDPRADDIRLLSSQSQRCREILRKLTSMGVDPDSPLERMPLPQLLEELTAPHREFGIEIALERHGAAGSEPVFSRNPAILYGLGNIIENAIDFATERVDVSAEWDAETVTITVADDGRALPSRSSSGSANPMSPPAAPRATARRCRRRRPSGVGSASASSSPRRCSNAPAPASPSPTANTRSAAPSSPSCGRARPSKGRRFRQAPDKQGGRVSHHDCRSRRKLYKSAHD